MTTVFANITSHEEDVGLFGERVILFPWPVKNLNIANDSDTEELEWKFKSSHEYSTLQPGESLNIDVDIKQIVLRANGAIYRLWGLG